MPAGPIIVGVLTAGALLGVARAATASQRKPRPGKLPTRFDPIFERHCGNVPVAYARALTKKESNFDPNDQKGPAWGLMQVVEVLRRSHNDQHGTNFTREDLLDPDTNVKIACGLLNQITRLYANRHPRTFGAQFDFLNRRQVELLTFGWNAGFSSASGVSFVVRQLEAQGTPGNQIDVDAVHRHALDDPRAVRFLRVPRRVQFAKDVTALYFNELRREGAV